MNPTHSAITGSTTEAMANKAPSVTNIEPSASKEPSASNKEPSASKEPSATSKEQNNKNTPGQTTSLAMIATLGSVAMLSGLLVVLTWQLTLEPIKENQRIMIEKAIFQVIPGAQQRQTFTLTDTGLETGLQTSGSRKKESQKNNLAFYAAYDNKGQLKGIAAEATAQGYADMVRLLYGYDPQCECIRGFSIIKMAETPGLGDKILTDHNFLANFNALDARLNNEKTALKNAIVTVKHGSKSNPWEIDAISGATITSKAVGKAINQSAEQLLPRLQPFIEQLHSLQKEASGDLQKKASGDLQKKTSDEKQMTAEAASSDGHKAKGQE